MHDVVAEAAARAGDNSCYSIDIAVNLTVWVTLTTRLPMPIELTNPPTLLPMPTRLTALPCLLVALLPVLVLR